MLDFRQYSILSYGGFQDWYSTFEVQDAGNTLAVQGNGWKKIDFDYEVTPNTVLEFEFKSTAQGEIHGIGFDVDDGISSDRIFQLYGSQNWGINAFQTYSPNSGNDGWVSYRIPVGQFYTGTMQYLTFANDHDVFFPTAASQFRNLRVFETVPPNPVEGLLDLRQFVFSAYADQDRGSNAQVSGEGSTVELEGNNWKKISFPYSVTANTVLELEFRSLREGEIHGIGFDADNRLSDDRIFKLHGTQAWGIRDFDNYSGNGDWQSYRIRVGDFFTGDMAYLVFSNDHDVSNPTAQSAFRNIRIYEAAVDPPQPGRLSLSSDQSNLTEGETAFLTVTRDGGSDGAVSVEIRQLGGEAQSGVDFAALLPLTVSFADGESGSKTIALPTLDDSLYEPGGEILQLGLVNATGGATLGNGSLSLAIADNDEQPPLVFEAGAISGVRSFANSLSSNDPDHVYRFSVGETSDFNLILEGLSANANVVLRRGSGLDGEIIATANRAGNQAELLYATLLPGDYSLRLELPAGGAAASSIQTSAYDLIVTATPDRAETSHNLAVTTATYLGGLGDDTATAVELSPNHELVVAGNFSRTQGNNGSVLLGANGSSRGQIVRLSPSGREVLSVTHVGNDIRDLAVNLQTGAIAVVGDFGVAVLNATGNQVLWSRSVGTAVDRVAIANDGTVVTLHNKTVTTWNSNGQQIAQAAQVRSYVNDVAIHPDTNRVYVTGFDNKNNSFDNNNPVQVAFLNAFSPNNLSSYQWQNWGFDGNILTSNGQNDMADTRGYRVSVGRDGMLYFLGEVAGGNSIFRWNGQDRSTPTLVKYDAYNDPYNSKSPHQAYYARLDPNTGAVLQGQLAFARLNGDSSAIVNAFRVDNGAIAADEAGNVYISGQGFSKIKDRDINQIDGQTVGGYVKGELTALVVASDFQSRRLWTPFTQNVGRGQLQGIAVGYGRAAALGSVSQGTVITANQALNPTPFNLNPYQDSDSGDLRDVYLATWGTDSLNEFVSWQTGTGAADTLLGGRSGDLFWGAGGSDRLTGNGGADAFRYDAPQEGGDLITDFGNDDQIRIRAEGFGLVAGASAPLVLGSSATGSAATFLYNQGVLSFDADGWGSGAPMAIATLSGSPTLRTEQIRLI